MVVLSAAFQSQAKEVRWRQNRYFRDSTRIVFRLERVQLETEDQMHQMGDIIQLYEPGPLPALEPILHLGFLAHVLCRVPLIPCYMGGSEHPTVPHRFARSSKVSNGRADRHIGTGDGSRLYEVNMWTLEIRARNAKTSHSG